MNNNTFSASCDTYGFTHVIAEQAALRLGITCSIWPSQDSEFLITIPRNFVLEALAIRFIIIHNVHVSKTNFFSYTLHMWLKTVHISFLKTMRIRLVPTILASSANKSGWDLLFTIFGKSFIKRRKSKGPGTEYCVTSCFNFLQLEKFCS